MLNRFTALTWKEISVITVLLICSLNAGNVWPEAQIVADHSAVAGFDQIPDKYIREVRTKVIHYVGQSHSRQITHGLGLIQSMDERFTFETSETLDEFSSDNNLKVLRSSRNDGNNGWSTDEDYLGEEDYWATADGRAMTRNTLNYTEENSMTLDLSLFMWCWDILGDNFCYNENYELITFNDERYNTYVTFVDEMNNDEQYSETPILYVTAVTDGAGAGYRKWRVTKYNDMIRQAAYTNGGILYDNADIENWNMTDTEQRIDYYTDDENVEHECYIRHADYEEDVGVPYESGHTNEALCIRKAKALWWMVARMSGWDGTPAALTLTSPSGGEVWSAETARTLRWTAKHIDTVSIDYSLDGGDIWVNILDGIDAGTGEAVWNIPDMASENILIRVRDAEDNVLNSISEGTLTIKEALFWGDIDHDRDVDSTDASDIATYDVDPLNDSIADLLENIQICGDVNQDGNIDIIDALICASYELDSTNPNLPVETGQVVFERSALEKRSADQGSATAELHAEYDPENDIFELTPLIKTDDGISLIGAAHVSLHWDSSLFEYFGTGTEEDNSAINQTSTENGHITMARFSATGLSVFALPTILLRRKAEGAARFEFLVDIAGDAVSFENITISNSHVVGVEDSRPQMLPVLYQNAPNPFNPSTQLSFYIPDSSEITLRIYSITGQCVKSIYESELLGHGIHFVEWDGKNDNGRPVSSGLYLYRLSSEVFALSRSMLMIK